MFGTAAAARWQVLHVSPVGRGTIAVQVLLPAVLCCTRHHVFVNFGTAVQKTSYAGYLASDAPAVAAQRVAARYAALVSHLVGTSHSALALSVPEVGRPGCTLPCGCGLCPCSS
jgi:hypothetical protein